MSNRILHLFQWNLRDIINNLKYIKESKWDSILINPIQPNKEPNGDWYMNYQIINLSIGNHVGTKEDLIELCNKAHKLGLNIYIDTVITHYANKDGGKGKFIPHELVDKELVNNKYFWREKKSIDYNSRWSITHNCNDLASIDVSNYDYQDLVINFYNELIDCGVDGLRIDSAKMISLPEEDSNNFFPRVINGLKKDIFVFGEVIHESQGLLNMYQKHISVLTNLSNEAYNIDRNKEIVFVESHDSYKDNTIGYTKRLSEEQILENYKYLTKDFPNTLFYCRPFSEVWRYANNY